MASEFNFPLPPNSTWASPTNSPVPPKQDRYLLFPPEYTAGTRAHAISHGLRTPEAPPNSPATTDSSAAHTLQEGSDPTPRASRERSDSCNTVILASLLANCVNSGPELETRNRRLSESRFRSFIPRLKKIKDDTSWLKTKPEKGGEDGKVECSRRRVVAKFQSAEKERRRRSLIPQPVKQLPLPVEEAEVAGVNGSEEDVGPSADAGAEKEEEVDVKADVAATETANAEPQMQDVSD